MKVYHKRLAYFLFLCLLLLTYLIYLQGINGALYYDDFRPLSGLAQITDDQSALTYVLGEISGPLGRPISMLTFLFNQQDWPNNISAFLHFNILLHGINGLFVFALCWQLVRLASPQQTQPAWLALAASALWLLSPLLISTSLIAVQRMAGLSAFFQLLGLVTYLACFFRFQHHPQRRLFAQALCIGLFTLLAIFSKENGILLPIFALVLESTLLRTTAQTQAFRRLRLLAFSACLLVILGYLVSTLPHAAQAYESRPFTLFERVITQPVILFDYLRLAFLPSIFSYSPFHDHYPIYQSLTELPALFAMLTLASLLVSAVLLRKNQPWFSFAVLWFLAAHLLESSVIGLELYFEHRNYLALIGPCLALGVALSKVPAKFQLISRALFALYLCLLAFSSYQVTSIWGNQALAGQLWFEHKPGSARASEHFAIQLLEANQTEQAYWVLQQQAINCPDCIGSQMQAMQLACRFNDAERVTQYYQQGMQLSKIARSLGSAPSSLAAIITDVKDENCTLLSYDQLTALNTALLKHQHYGLGQGSRLALLVNLHQIANAKQDTDANIGYLLEAWQVKNDRSIAEILVGRLIEAQRLDDAQAFIDQEMCAPTTLPKIAVLKQQELARCERATGWVQEAREPKE